jgi:L-fuculose-phosphate aldolase
MIGVTGGSTLRVSDYAEFGTQALSDTMLAALKDRAACLLANHGQIAFGPISTRRCGSRARSRRSHTNIGRQSSLESRSSFRMRK